MAKFRYFYQVKKINFFIVRFIFYKILGGKHLYNVDKVLARLNPGILNTSDCNDTCERREESAGSSPNAV